MGTGIVSPGHLAIVLVVVLLVFGAKRLPELGRSLGSGMREFKDSINPSDDRTAIPPSSAAPRVDERREPAPESAPPAA